MARYIDAEKLEATFNPCMTGKDAYTAGQVLITIQTTPTEDVAPVVHAHWIETEDLAGNHYIECSHCHWDFWLEGENAKQAELFHCPRCGAKMDEKEGQR